MSRIQRFEDFIAWQKARRLTDAIYRVTREGRFARDFGLCDQIRRASVSIMSNIAEGFERDGENEFFRYLTIAKASCAEVRSQLYVALDAGYMDDVVFGDLYAQAEEVGRLIAGLRNSVVKRRTEKE